jgi:hypothetical protein
MRRWSLTVPVLVIACGVLGFSAAPANAGAGDKLVVDSVTEPPDTQARGGKWRLTVTVSNEGGERSTSDRISWFLSRGRRFSEDDLQRRLTGTVNLPALNANRQATRRVTLGIPQTIQDGAYYLVTCLGRTARNTDNLNCRFSGQTMRIGGAVQGGAQSQSAPGGAGGPGATGPQGPQGERGAAGVAAPGALIQIDRTTLPFGTATGSQSPDDGRGSAQPDEGSSQSTQLAKVGPVQVRALCRTTTNGDGDAPGSAFDPGFSFEEDGDEAFIALRLDDGAGTMTWRGPQGPRRNIPPGDSAPTQTVQKAAATDAGGLGKHIALATARDPQPAGTPNASSGPEDDWETAFISGSVLVATSNGTEFVLNAFAGIDVLGVGDQCVFGGGITVIKET